MNTSFVIADTHYRHKKVIEFEPYYRPFNTIEEHDAELIYRHNQVVRKKDTVWFLGDVIFGKEAFSVLDKLNGIKKLVMGNHDKYPTATYLKYFNKIYATAEIHDCILTHIPIHPSQFRKHKLNIHGHMHSNSLDDLRYVCVSAEQINLTPINLIKLINRSL